MPIYIPRQGRSLDPYDANKSSAAHNLKSRVWTCGNNVILFPDSSLRLVDAGSLVVKVTPGIVIKNDILIHILPPVENGIELDAIYMDVTDVSEYYWVIDGDEITDLPINYGGTPAYVILRYIPGATQPAPSARILVTKSSADLLGDPNMYLGTITFDPDTYEVSNVSHSSVTVGTTEVKRNTPLSPI